MKTAIGKKIITAIGSLALMSMASVSMAEKSEAHAEGCNKKHHSMHHDRKGGERHHERMADALALTDEQKQSLAEQRKAQSEDMRAQHKQMRQVRQELKKATAENASEAELDALASQLGDLTKQQALAHAKNQQYLLSILTDEQKTKMAELKTERQKKWTRGKKDVSPEDSSAI